VATANAILDTARKALSLGISVIPPAEDGTKRPLPNGSGEWKQYQNHRTTEAEIARWYGPHTGLGIVCGGISHGLELFEFDDRDTYEQFKEAAVRLGGGPIIDRIEAGYLEVTPGNGVHWFYYASDVRGSTKLATRRLGTGPTAFVKTLIETKGEGGFVIVAPTHGRVHPTGKPYERVKGGLDTIAELRAAERDWLWDLARTFGDPDPKTETVDNSDYKGRTGDWGDTLSPGQDFNERASWQEILEGWTLVFSRGDTQYWRRPGKDIGCSATVNHTGKNRLHVFTSSSGFEPNTSYSKFGAFAHLYHRGDHKDAARALAAAGYGTHKRWEKDARGVWGLHVFPNPCPKGSKAAKPADPPPAEPIPKPGHTGVPVAAEDYEGLSDADLGLVPADTIDPEPIVWEWPNRLARGKLNLVAGEGGDGKSQIAIAVVAAKTTGGIYPDGSGPAEVGTCCILAAEDGARDTIIPRLIAAGADRSRVLINTAKVTVKQNERTLISPVSFQDLAYWKVVLTRHKIRILIADPLPAYLGKGVNDHRNNEVRAVLEPFVDLLDELGVAFMAITHLGKSTDHKSPLHKILGSVAYYNLARTVHCTYRDDDDPERRYFCLVKSNIMPPQASLAFRIQSFDFEHDDREIKTSRVAFEDMPVDFNATDHVNGKAQKGNTVAGGRPPSKSLRDAEWLFELLFANNWMPFVKIVDAAGEAGLLGEQKPDGSWQSITPLYRAKERITELTGDRANFTVDDDRLPYGRQGKNIVHWRLTPLDAPFTGPVNDGSADDPDTPF
jgi:hypothetical protein